MPNPTEAGECCNEALSAVEGKGYFELKRWIRDGTPGFILVSSVPFG